jgi:MoxR-like ATPase
MAIDIEDITREVEQQGALVERLTQEIGKIIVGQRYMVERLVIGLLANGHVLLEGVPGLAKTLTCRTLATCIDARFSRIQFTPDLLPADLIGTLIYNQKEQTFEPKLGPIFSNIVLADEINRAPAKVQSALLEAMQERQVTIGDRTYKLEDPFMVLATQNPIEQEGTYPLPEAQTDRFLLKLHINYPQRSEEYQLLDKMTSVVNAGGARGELPRPQPVITPADLRTARTVIDSIYVDEKVKEYVLDIVGATREPARYKLQFRSKDGRALEEVIAVGASPRASLALVVAGKCHAFLRRRGHVTPDDIKAIGPDVLRHRIMITFEAEAEELTHDEVVRQLFDQVEVP